MQVNNHNQNSFRGMYIIKGNGNSVIDATANICKRCSNPILNNIINQTPVKTISQANNLKAIDGFKTCSWDALTGYFGEKQPLVEFLITTNDDTNKLEDYYINAFGLSEINTEDDIDEANILKSKRNVEKFLKKYIDDFMEYTNAQQKCIEEGNASFLASFIVKKAIKAKEKLSNILKPYSIDKNDIRILRADTPF